MFQVIPILGAGYDVWYACAFLLGLLVLLLFSLEKFDQPYPGNRHLAELLPSNISPGSAYIKAFLIYFFILLVMYGVTCVILPTVPKISTVLLGFDVSKSFNLSASPVENVDAGVSQLPRATPAVPFAVALLMVGLLPKAKSFGQIEAPLRRFSHRLIGVPGGFAELERVVARLSLDTALLDGRERNIRGKIMRLFLARQRARAPNQAKVKLEQWLEAGDLEAPLPQPTGDGLTGEDARFLSQLEEQVSNAKNVADKWYRAKFLMGRLENPPPTRNIFDAGVAVRFAKLRSDLLGSYAEVRRSIERIGQDVESLVDLLKVLVPLHSGFDRLAPNRARSGKLG